MAAAPLGRAAGRFPTRTVPGADAAGYGDECTCAPDDGGQAPTFPRILGLQTSSRQRPGGAGRAPGASRRPRALARQGGRLWSAHWSAICHGRRCSTRRQPSSAAQLVLGPPAFPPVRPRIGRSKCAPSPRPANPDTLRAHAIQAKHQANCCCSSEPRLLRRLDAPTF